jgi:hypothetical protein
VKQYIGQNRAVYNPNNVAKKTLEFSITVSREQLCPNYGDGFRGAPLRRKKNGRTKAEQNRGVNEPEEKEDTKSEA